MNPSWDLMAYDKNGQLVLSVDIRKSPTASPEWAAEFRKNILAHGVYPITPYFLVALADQFFLWKNGDVADPGSKPTYTIDATSIVDPYLKRLNSTADDIDRSTFKLILSAWLGKLIYHGCPQEEIKKEARWLVDSGLYDAINGGSLAYGE
ncbi:MAG: hypothetical protein ACOYNY_28500 [Caldilineaceae bacterium]|jgi:hypothetical protein